MEDKMYLLRDILKDDNLILNLRLDSIFKKVFLNENSKPYLCLLLSKIYNISYNNLINEVILINGELPSKNLEKKSSCTDMVLRFRNIDFIIEMNYHEKDYTLEKNNSYLFNLHTSKVFNNNKYGKNIYTYLLNIDDYDILNKKDLIYKSNLNYYKYNMCMYNNIKITHFNLAKLRDKLYNKSEKYNLTELEKLLVVFVCQRKDILKKITNNKEVEGVIKIMEKLKLDTKLPTYDYEEFLRQERIGFEKKQEEYNKKEEEYNKNINEFNNEKFELAKKLIKIGFSKNEIQKITKLSSKQLSII